MSNTGRTISKTPLTGTASGALTLSTTPTNITGCSISITPGKWIVSGVFDFICAGTDTSQVALGSLLLTGGTGTVANSSSQATFAFQAAGDRGTVTQTWYVSVTATTTATLQGAKSGGTGTSTAGNVHSNMIAWYVGE